MITLLISSSTDSKSCLIINDNYMHVYVETFWGNLKFANGYIIVLLTFLNEYHALSVQSTLFLNPRTSNGCEMLRFLVQKLVRLPNDLTQKTATTLSYSYTQNLSKPKKETHNKEKYTLLKKKKPWYKLNVKLRKCFDLLFKRTENYYVTLPLLL